MIKPSSPSRASSSAFGGARYIICFCFILLAATNVWSAACCGGGFAAPSIISGDDRAQFTGSISYAEITDHVDADGVWRRTTSKETSETLRIDQAHIFLDRWQAGLALPIVKRQRSSESSTGLGDVAGTLGYEFLPDWDYNPWRPQGIGFLQLILPTGKSILEADSKYQLESRGRGFWALGLGSLFSKTFSRWDAVLSFEAHRSFAKSVHTSQLDGTLQPGFGGSLSVGSGYNLRDFRVGSSLTWTYEDPIKIQGSVESESALQRYATFALQGSYLASDSWATTVLYSDQALFGSPLNTSLSRAVMLLVQRRWQR